MILPLIVISLFYRNCFVKKTGKASLLIIQSERGDQNSELIACARYSVQRELQEIFQEDNISKVYVIFLIQLSGMAGSYFSGFQVHNCVCFETLY